MLKDVEVIMDSIKNKFLIPEADCKKYKVAQDLEEWILWTNRLLGLVDIPNPTNIDSNGFVSIDSIDNGAYIEFDEEAVTNLPCGFPVLLVINSNNTKYSTNSKDLLEILACTGKNKILKRFLRRIPS